MLNDIRHDGVIENKVRKQEGFMKKQLKKTIVERAIAMFISVSILLGSVFAYGDVAMAAVYDSDEIVIETENLNKSGTTIFNGEILTTKNLTDMHDGIIRMLDDNTEIFDVLQYGDNNYSNENSIFSNDYIQINVGNVKLANVIVAEGDITFNASTMCSEEYTIIYSKSGDIRFNIGNMDFTGIIYAPNGEVTFSSSDVCVQGRIVASVVNIYAGIFEIDGIQKYSNVVDMLEFLSGDIVLEISREYNEESNKYSIDIVSGNEAAFDSFEVYIRYDKEKEFSYLCDLNEFGDVGIVNTYDTVDLIIKGTTKYNEAIFSNVRSFHMDGEKVLYAHLDTDEDKIADGEEIIITNTNPYKADSDDDGISDYVECFYLLTDPNSKTADEDYDKDGLSNFTEINRGTNPFVADCDFDGLLDGEDSEPLIYDAVGIEPDYEVTCVVIGKYDKIMNGCDENGEIYQYIFNYMTDQIKSIRYNEEEIIYFYDVNSNMISDVRKYQDEYRVSSSKYDTDGNVIAYSNNANIYEYTYDQLSNVTSATINGNPIVTMSEEATVYGNGDIIHVKELDNGHSYSVNGEEVYLVSSEAEQGIERYQDNKLGINYQYKYTEDILDYISTNTGYKIKYSNDDNEYIVNYTYGDVNKEQIIYLNSELAETILISGDSYKKYKKDDSVIYSVYNQDSTLFEMKFDFINDKIAKVLYNDGEEISYTYNKNNQVISVSEGESKIWEYEYNLVGQLTSAYNYIDKTVEKYSYDMYNNIKNVETYAYDGVIGECLDIDTYEYESDENTDRVTTFNGTELLYDEIGNPLTYYDGKEFSWSGRNLEVVQMNNGYVEYAYDKNGLRVQKDVDGKVTNYYYEGEDIIVEASDEHVIWYIYDDTTNVIGFSYAGNDYYYVKNASHDVIAIIDDDGKFVCGYQYDPWGNILNIDGNVDIAEINPIRYRSYYYDKESCFYYLKTRYYDPEIRRFISMDDVCDVAYEMVDPNLYAYCCNDPVNLYDPEGKAALNIAIFSIPESYYQVKDYLKDDLIETFDSTVYIDHKLGSYASDFISWWNGLEKKDIVIIWTHGNPSQLYSEGLVFKFERADIGDNLEYKEIKLLILIACNAGHYNHRTMNMASSFAKKVSGAVMASDGTVTSHKDFYYGIEPYVYLDSNSSGEFSVYINSALGTRDNMGWLVYNKKSKEPKELGLMRLDAEQIKLYYNWKIWLRYK